MKRKLPIKLKLTASCARSAGIKPFKKWTSSQKKAVSSCVAKRMRTAR